VKAIDENSRQLAEALVDGTKIVITTLQKFPFILRGLCCTLPVRIIPTIPIKPPLLQPKSGRKPLQYADTP
jgi:hypothetical protein